MRASARSRKIQDIQVADCRQNKSVLDAYTVSEYSLKFWNNCAADDGGNEQTRPFAGQRSQALGVVYVDRNEE